MIGEQGALKFRLMRAAESLDAMVLLAVRGFDRIEQLEQQLASLRSHPADRPVTTVDPPMVIVGGVDVAPLATAVNAVSLVENTTSDGWATEGIALRASLRVARALVQETFEDLKAASGKGGAMNGRPTASARPQRAQLNPSVLRGASGSRPSMARMIHSIWPMP